MILKDILRKCDLMQRGTDSGMDRDNRESVLDIKGIAYDSRKVQQGFLFIAVKGETYDGHDFLQKAIKQGAVAIVHEQQIERYSPEIRYIHVKNSRKALACAANNFCERPSEKLTLVGITGTNGKTTTSYLLKSILEVTGVNVGLIGTIHYMIKDKVFPAVHTTPESLEFQSLLKEMLLAGCQFVVSEISSHALAQYRVDGAVFQTALFTNLTRDHLDFHKTMESYFNAKARLFTELLQRKGTAVINLDDVYGWNLNMDLRIGDTEPRNIITYGLATQADLLARDIVNSFEGLQFTLSFRGKAYAVRSPLTGIPNVYNILAASGAALSLGIPLEDILKGISQVSHIKGRFEKVETGQGFLCVIDYAHTEDALERLIRTARELLDQQSVAGKGNPTPRIITVFGCGGDRDRGKRPIMGAVATNLSDFAIITSDNPRSEEPSAIIRDIEAGATGNNYIIEIDRREAIRKAIQKAKEGDIVLIAGKGHEEYQEINGIRYRFSDREVIEEALKLHHEYKEDNDRSELH
jgi:UDP-N-acetylmuramoyl-L-alanyl-D-glutamate--2,6-diaminopimelate ligase